MKKLLVLTLAVVLTSIRLSAQTVLFNPDFSNQTGYTTVTNSGGTVTYSGDTMTDGDISNAVTAYATGAGTDTGVENITSHFTFTPTFTANPTFKDSTGPGQNTYSGNYEGIQLYQIRDASNSNGNLLNVALNISTYNNDDQIVISSGLQFGGGIQAGNNIYYAPGGINALSGQTLTLQDVLTLDNSNENPTTFAGFVLTNNATLYNSQGQVLYTFSYTNTSRAEDTNPAPGEPFIADILGSNFNPAHDNLTFNVGDIVNGAPESYGYDSANGANDMPTGSNFLESPASVTISKVIATIPEPSTYALLLAGGALGLAIVRRKIVS